MIPLIRTRFSLPRGAPTDGIQVFFKPTETRDRISTPARALSTSVTFNNKKIFFPVVHLHYFIVFDILHTKFDSLGHFIS